MKTDETGINASAAPSGDGCVECLRTGGWWLHLRRCAQCGHIGCCDNSPARHATKHFHATDHPVIRSFEPGEVWFYDYRNDDFFDGPPLHPPLSHPLNQPAPGPRGKVPENWEQLLNP